LQEATPALAGLVRLAGSGWPGQVGHT